jgi:uncharacterized protein YkwD
MPGNSFISILMALLLITLIFVLFPSVPTHLVRFINDGFNFSTLNPNLTTVGNLYYPTTTIKENYVPQNALIAYALSVINKDRLAYNLSAVSYSSIASAQQHSENMLQNDYFSHWDIYGMKPYMRYSLLGGNQSVDENIAFIYNSSGVNLTNAISQMEYDMMYNDSKCCNNGHRDNILTPQHNYVSIGVAYNATTVYFTEDFINDYINWFYGTPSINNGIVRLNGSYGSNYALNEVLVTFDPPISSITPFQLKHPPYNASYGYGTTIAGIGYTRESGGYRYSYTYGNITTLNATEYVVQGDNFAVSFNMSNLIRKYGPGEYTIMILLNSTATNPKSSFLAATHTIFINASGGSYIPDKV